MTPVVDAQGLALPGRLEPTDFQVAPGELVCVVGPNGAGKTSLLHAIAGIANRRGSVSIGGIDPQRLSPDQRKALLAYLPASRDVAWPVIARDLIALGLPAGTPPGRAIAELDLEPLLDRRVDHLSTGERSRVLIARALAAEPRLLLLDEPAANLDPYWQLRLMDLLRARMAENGRAAMVAVHDLDLAAAWCDRLIVVDKGRVVGDGAPAELLDGSLIREVFRIERTPIGWRPLSPAADRRSSP